jgi:hypothetical protein
MRYTTQENSFQRDTHLGLGNQRYFHKNLDTGFKRTAITQGSESFRGSYLPYDLSSIHHAQKEMPLLQYATFSSVPVMLNESRKIFQSPVVQKAEKKKTKQRTQNYQTVEGGWHDTAAMTQHCFTYCGEEQLVWVKFAYTLGMPPPMFGHGSLLEQDDNPKKKGQNTKQSGTAKDEKMWQAFHTRMLQEIVKRNLQGRSPYAIAEKAVKNFEDETPKWW